MQATLSRVNTHLSRPAFWGLAEKQLEAGCTLRNAHVQALVQGLGMRGVWGHLPQDLGSGAGWCGTRSQASYLLPYKPCKLFTLVRRLPLHQTPQPLTVPVPPSPARLSTCRGPSIEIPPKNDPEL